MFAFILCAVYWAISEVSHCCSGHYANQPTSQPARQPDTHTHDTKNLCLHTLLISLDLHEVGSWPQTVLWFSFQCIREQFHRRFGSARSLSLRSERFQNANDAHVPFHFYGSDRKIKRARVTVARTPIHTCKCANKFESILCGCVVGR